MGTDMADFNGDGLADLLVTNLDVEYLAIYQNQKAFFEEVSSVFEVQLPSRNLVGFGVGFVDFDNDSDLDIFVANGHILDNITQIRPGSAYAQPKLLFENRGDRFVEVAAQRGSSLVVPQVSRGLALGDYDHDGDVDLLVSNCGQSPMLLHNRMGNRNNWLEVRLKGVRSNSNAIGARLELKVGQDRFLTQVVGGGSYLSASSYRVHIGLGKREQVEELKIIWPSGVVDIVRAKGLGRHFWVEIRRVVGLLLEYPESGREIREGIRKWQLRKFRYAIIYSQPDAHVLILAIAHNSRRPDYWMDRLEKDP